MRNDVTSRVYARGSLYREIDCRLHVVVMCMDGSDVSRRVEKHGFCGEESFNAGVVERNAVDAAQHGAECEEKIGIGGECLREVGPQCLFAYDTSAVVSEDLDDEGRVEGHVIGVVFEDAIEVMTVPCLDPSAAEACGGQLGHDHLWVLSWLFDSVRLFG